MARHPDSFSSAQVAFHWIVVVLVAFQFLAHNGMERAWRAFQTGEPTPGAHAVLTYMHIAIGLTVFVLMLARLFLRLTRGVPAPPKDDMLAMRLVADLIHWLIYALLIALPPVGLLAWFGGIGLAATAHELMSDVLLYTIALHIGGALFQHFVRRSEVLIRMFMLEEDKEQASPDAPASPVR